MRSRSAFFKNPRRLLGVSLIEALIAFLIVGIGLLGVAKLQTAVFGVASSTEQRNQAIHLAQETMECFRAWPSACAATYADIGTGSGPDISRGGAVFHRSWEVVTQSSNPAYKVLRVTVTWDDKQGSGGPTRQVVLEGKISDVPQVVTTSTALSSSTSTSTTSITPTSMTTTSTSTTSTTSTSTTSTTSTSTTSTTSTTATTSTTTTTSSTTTTTAPTTTTTTAAPTTTTTTTTTTVQCTCKANNATPPTSASLQGSNPAGCTNACCNTQSKWPSGLTKNQQFTVYCP